MLMIMSYYRWGNWRKASILGKQAHATPAEVPATPPSPVADPDPELELELERSEAADRA